MHHVCRKLQLQSGQSVVEAGCGWESLGLPPWRATTASRCVRSTSRTSRIVYARAARASGRFELAGGIRRGRLPQYLRALRTPSSPSACSSTWDLRTIRNSGRIANQSLSRHGRGLIHSIGRNYPAPLHAWIERRIFPGAYCAFDRRDDADFRTLGSLSARCREPAPALCQDPAALARALTRRRSERVKSMLMRNSCACGASTSQARSPAFTHGHPAAFPGGVCAAGRQRDPSHPRSPVPGLSGKGKPCAPATS